MGKFKVGDRASWRAVPCRIVCTPELNMCKGNTRARGKYRILCKGRTKTRYVSEKELDKWEKWMQW